MASLETFYAEYCFFPARILKAEVVFVEGRDGANIFSVHSGFKTIPVRVL